MKKTILCILALLLVCTTALFCANESKSVFTASLDSRPVIILDAGHGGFDGGAVAFDGTVEKDINLRITLVLSSFLKNSGYRVVLTRDSDTGTEDNATEQISRRKKSDLDNRINLMAQYPNSVFVSVHLNKFTTSAASGAQVFYSKNNDQSKQLGDLLQGSISSLLQKENKRVAKQGNSSIYLLERATVPTVIVECGFLSNSKDLELLKTDEYQKKMAFCIYCGILSYHSNNSIV